MQIVRHITWNECTLHCNKNVPASHAITDFRYSAVDRLTSVIALLNWKSILISSDMLCTFRFAGQNTQHPNHYIICAIPQSSLVFNELLNPETFSCL